MRYKKFINKYGITSDIQLHELAEQIGFKVDYIGFAEDFNPSIKKFPYLSIINLGGSNDLAGTHWCGLVIFKNNNAFYFDSYAGPSEDILLLKLKNIGVKNLVFNDYFQLQGLTEELCGIWVLLFLNYFSKLKNPTTKKMMDQFIDFTKNYEDLNGSYKSSDFIGESIKL